MKGKVLMEKRQRYTIENLSVLPIFFRSREKKYMI